MRFEWDEAKRQWVLEDRGIDLLDMQRLFDGRPVLSYASPQHDENRWTTVGLVQNRSSPLSGPLEARPSV
jgi:uncharacterized DUF497 family protein